MTNDFLNDREISNDSPIGHVGSILNKHSKTEQIAATALPVARKILAQEENLIDFPALCKFLDCWTYSNDEQCRILSVLDKIAEKCPRTMQQMFVLLNSTHHETKLKCEMAVYVAHAARSSDSAGESVAAIFSAKGFDSLVHRYPGQATYEMVWHIGRTAEKFGPDTAGILFKAFLSDRFQILAEKIGPDPIIMAYGYMMENTGDARYAENLAGIIENDVNAKSLALCIGLLAAAPLPKDVISDLSGYLSTARDDAVKKHIAEKIGSIAGKIDTPGLKSLIEALKSRQFSIIRGHYVEPITNIIFDSLKDTALHQGNSRAHSDQSKRASLLLHYLLDFYCSTFTDISKRYPLEETGMIIYTASGIVGHLGSPAMLEDYGKLVLQGLKHDDISYLYEWLYTRSMDSRSHDVLRYVLTLFKEGRMDLLDELKDALDRFWSLPAIAQSEIGPELFACFEKHITQRTSTAQDVKFIFKKYGIAIGT